ncbi:pleiotropic regulatory locus 1 [Actinidia rufa]|uniref:Pleiotropic regulatory locus 1 n=1 Tax=Actinidia rufa TaxID=165716 RepID=A0A7J0GT42_9ERIC|nr:pleiotropic regulatory locus 1 [Actinidia rufa]
MPGPTLEMEPVEPQSLKKLSFKSLKRSLDFFSPLHSHFPPPDPDSKKIRISHKFNAEYGGIKSNSQPSANANSVAQDQAQQASGTSNALALPGPENSKDPRNGGAQTNLIVGPTVQAKGLDVVLSGKSTAVVSAPGSSERNLSTSAIMERIPSKWPRPVWHPPWKNYRVRAFLFLESLIFLLSERAELHPSLSLCMIGSRFYDFIFMWMVVAALVRNTMSATFAFLSSNE